MDKINKLNKNKMDRNQEFHKHFEISNQLKNRKFVNYEIEDLLYDDKKILDFDVKLSNGKNLQRGLVWNDTQKQSLILSMFKGLKLPQFHIVTFKDYNDDVKFDERQRTIKIIDGKQRLCTIDEFIKNEFFIEVGGKNYFFKDLDVYAQNHILSFVLDCIVFHEVNWGKVSNTPDRRLSDAELIEWFELVNFAGTPQDKEHMVNLRESLK